MSRLMRLDEIYAALSSDAALNQKVKGIYEDVPEKAKAPYIVLGEVSERSGGRIDASLGECDFDIHIWSKSKSKLEILEIKNLIVKAMPVGFILWDFEIIRDDTDKTLWWHGVVTFRYYDNR